MFMLLPKTENLPAPSKLETPVHVTFHRMVNAAATFPELAASQIVVEDPTSGQHQVDTVLLLAALSAKLLPLADYLRMARESVPVPSEEGSPLPLEALRDACRDLDLLYAAAALATDEVSGYLIAGGAPTAVFSPLLMVPTEIDSIRTGVRQDLAEREQAKVEQGERHRTRAEAKATVIEATAEYERRLPMVAVAHLRKGAPIPEAFRQMADLLGRNPEEDVAAYRTRLDSMVSDTEGDRLKAQERQTERYAAAKALVQ